MTPLRIATSLALISIAAVPLAQASAFAIAERRVGASPVNSGMPTARMPALAVGALGSDFVLQTHGAFPVTDDEPGPRIALKHEPHVARVSEDRLIVVWAEGESFDSAPDLIAASLLDDDGRVVRTLDPVRREQGLPLFPGRIAANNRRALVPGECLSPRRVRSVCATWIDIESGAIGVPQLIEEDAVAPSAAWNGREFLLTYVAGPFTERTLRARVLDADGAVGSRITLGGWFPFSHTPSVHAVGDVFHVAWHTTSTTANLAQIVGGSVRATAELLVPAEDGVVPHLALNSHGDELIVVTGHGSLRTFRNLTPVTPWMTIVRSRHEVFHPRAVRTSAGWSVVYATGGGDTWPLRAVTINTDGSLGQDAAVGPAMRSFALFDTARTDSGFLAVWSRDKYPYRFKPVVSDVVARRFDGMHSPVTETRIVSIGVASQASPAAAFGGGAYLVAWSERRSDVWQIRLRRFALHGEPLGAPFDAYASDHDQHEPALAFNGESFLLVWSEGGGGRSAVRGLRLDSQGAILDTRPIEIAGESGVQRSGESVPARIAAVSWTGRHWLVASEESERIALRRITVDGRVLDPLPVLLPRAGESERLPVVGCASDGACLVAWQTYIPWSCPILCPTWPDSVAAIRVDGDLALLDPSPVILNARQTGPPAIPGNLSLSWDETQRAWLVVWTGLAGRRVSRTGELLDRAEGQAWYAGSFPSVISDGGQWRLLFREALYAPAPVFAGVTSTGLERGQLRSFVQIAPSSEQNLDVYLAKGPRPLALFVQAKEGIHRIDGEILSEVPPPGRRRIARP